MKHWICCFLMICMCLVSPIAAGVSVDTLKNVTATSIPELKKRYPRLKTVSFMNFDNMLLSDVLNFFSQEFGLNIMTKEIPTTSISFYFEKTHPLDAFQAILVSEGLTWYEQEKFIYVYKGKPISLVSLNYVGQSDIEDTISALIPDVELIFNETKNMVALKGKLDDVYRAKQLILQLDTVPQQVLVEVTVLDVDVIDNETFTLNAVFKPKKSDSSSTAGAVTEGVIASTPTTSSSAKGIELLNAATTGLRVHITDTNLTALIDAIKTVTNTKIVNTPKILAVNHKTASIFTGDRQGYTLKTLAISEDTQSQTIVNEDIDYLETGTSLEITPHITENGDIVLDISPEISTGSFGENNMPNEKTTQVNTTVRVKDGHSVIVGGLVTENVTKIRQGVPILMDIPLIKHFFSTNTENILKKEKLIILTPYLLTDQKRKEFNKDIPKF